MSRDIINVQYPTLDHTESVANICIEKVEVAPANGVTIAEAFSNKNNSLFIVIENFNKKRTPAITDFSQMTWKMALAIGAFQVLSLIPGTSRSGSTILGALLLAIPALLLLNLAFTWLSLLCLGQVC